MKKGFCPDGTRSRVVKMKMLSRYQSASIFQPGGAYIAKERWAHSGRLTGVAVPATSGSFLSSRYPTQLLPFSLPFPSIHGTTANANEFLTHISFFSFSPSLERGGQKKNAKLVTIANHGLDSNPCRLRMEDNRCRILRFEIASRGSCGRLSLFLFSFLSLSPLPLLSRTNSFDETG